MMPPVPASAVCGVAMLTLSASPRSQPDEPSSREAHVSLDEAKADVEQFFGPRPRPGDDRHGIRPDVPISEEVLVSFADQADDIDVRGRVPGQHRQQDGLADAGSREDPHALTAAAGQKGIDGPDAQVDLVAHALASMRRRRRTAQPVSRAQAVVASYSNRTS